ncbi:glycosyltransferase [Candidatus Sumerlaeota bacterium]|nr:glycosyltransferase [Candidatus Sumerlaeota bacterium]
MRVVHVNSTKSGGGVAEILSWLIPLMNELGLDASWEVIEGNAPFFDVTKSMHNGFQGNPVDLSDEAKAAYIETNVSNAERLRPILEGADFVFIHDPQPASQIELTPHRRGKWIWRCHIDASHPSRSVWKFVSQFARQYDASIFSMPQFAKSLPHPQFIIAPSIDPLSEKNRELAPGEIKSVRDRFGLDPKRPILTQISRFDRFKDPLGVVRAFRTLQIDPRPQLVLAGGGATDDPEGQMVLDEVRKAADGDPDIHILFLPGDAHTTINALQRASDIILQKSTREGFGLTVTEGLWKAKPVLGGDTGGIRLQVFNYHTGFLVNTPEGAAHRIRYLLQHRERMRAMGRKGREFVRENFLLTRHLREYLTLMLGLKQELRDHLAA